MDKEPQLSLDSSDQSSKPCNLCGALFEAASKFDRFCPYCKASDSRYRFAECYGLETVEFDGPEWVA
jgi:uncharacterized Zn-finger protein